MKKINILALSFLFSSSLFGQSIFKQIKNSYFDQFPKGKTHFFLKINTVLYADDVPRNLTNPFTKEILHNISFLLIPSYYSCVMTEVELPNSNHNILPWLL